MSDTIKDKLQRLIQTKSDIKDAIIAKGVEVDTSLPFSQYPSKIEEISGGEPIELEPNWYIENPNLTISSDNIASGFTNSNYMQFQNVNLNNSNNKSWEMNVKIKTPEVWDWSYSPNNKSMYFISCRNDKELYGEYGRYGVHFYLQQQSNNTVMLCADVSNSSGSGWLFTNSSGFKGGSLNANTIYYCKFSFDGINKYKIEYRTENTDFITAIERTDSNKTINNLLGNKLGVYGGTNLENPFYNGKMYLDNTYIKVDGHIVYQGVRSKNLLSN